MPEPKGHLSFADKAGISDPAILYRNVEGYGAVFDPDKALQTLADEAVDHLLNPQKTDSYHRAEFEPYDTELTEAMKDPDHRRDDVARIAVKNSTYIVSGADNTHILHWENEPPLTVNNNGEIIH